MISKKIDSNLDFLLTYGWAIFAAVVLIFVLILLGLFKFPANIDHINTDQFNITQHICHNVTNKTSECYNKIITTNYLLKESNFIVNTSENMDNYGTNDGTQCRVLGNASAMYTLCKLNLLNTYNITQSSNESIILNDGTNFTRIIKENYISREYLVISTIAIEQNGTREVCE